MASLKAKGLLNAIEGKTFLRKSGYVMLAEKAVIDPLCVRTSFLAHAFMAIDCNLMSRSQEVDHSAGKILAGNAIPSQLPHVEVKQTRAVKT